MQELNNFKNEMNLSGQNVYVGHRYVPKLDGEWDNTKTYEPLTIVTYQGNSFTSRQYVPIGAEITNEEFWVSTGNYNAQIEGYRQSVTNLDTEMRANFQENEEEFTSLKQKISNNKEYNVLDYNAKGDGVTDDTLAIQNLVNTLQDGDTIVFPKGAYLTTNTIHVKKSVKFLMQGYIFADHPKIGVLFKNDDVEGNFSSRTTTENFFLDVDISVIRVPDKNYEIEPTCVGVELWNVFHGKFNVKRIEGNNTGLKLVGEKYGNSYAAVTYSVFFIGLINSYKTNILLEANGDYGYVTQNQFYSGSLTGKENEGTVHVALMNNGKSVMNENIFYGMSLEGHYYTAIKGYNAFSNKFLDCRFELPKLKYLFDFENSRFNVIDDGYGVADHMRNMKYNNTGGETIHKDNIVNFYDYRSGKVEYFDDIFYIKPIKNKSGVYNSINNGVDSTKIPNEWNFEVIKNGLSDAFVYVNTSTTEIDSLLLRANAADKFNISEDRDNFPINNIRFTNPPKHTKEGYLYFRFDLKVPLNITVSSEFNPVIDKTGNNGQIPLNTKMVKYMYEYFSNTIYILEMI